MVERSVERYYLVDPRDVYYLSFTLEAYEGLAVVTTVDRTSGLVRVQIAPGWEDDLEVILHSDPILRRMQAVEREDGGTARGGGVA